MFVEIGLKCYIELLFYSNFGGYYVYFGKGVYVNFNLILVDDIYIYVGDYMMFGFNVIIVIVGYLILLLLCE